MTWSAVVNATAPFDFDRHITEIQEYQRAGLHAEAEFERAQLHADLQSALAPRV